MRRNLLQRGLMVLAVVSVVCPLAHAMEHITLRNGFELDCVRREAIGNKVRLYLAEDVPTVSNADTSVANYLEVAADAIVRVEKVADTPRSIAATKTPAIVSDEVMPTKEEIREMLAHSGAAHDIDADLLASVLKAESGGQVRAVSRTG